MPLYEYTNEELGISIVVPQNVDDRKDTIILKRRTIPRTLAVNTGKPAPTFEDNLRQGYKALESRGKLTQSKPGHLSAAQIKKALD